MRALFVERGALVVPYQKYRGGKEDLFAKRLLMPQLKYPAVMGQDARIDLVYFHDPKAKGVGIECKVQNDSGSADEKLFTMSDQD